ncbi:hypothetical protein SDJN02_25213, partial [Cucurbita argyrosperma subsp. argyrosperma]
MLAVRKSDRVRTGEHNEKNDQIFLNQEKGSNQMDKISGCNCEDVSTRHNARALALNQRLGLLDAFKPLRSQPLVVRCILLRCHFAARLRRYQNRPITALPFSRASQHFSNTTSIKVYDSICGVMGFQFFLLLQSNHERTGGVLLELRLSTERRRWRRAGAFLGAGVAAHSDGVMKMRSRVRKQRGERGEEEEDKEETGMTECESEGRGTLGQRRNSGKKNIKGEDPRS